MHAFKSIFLLIIAAAAAIAAPMPVKGRSVHHILVKTKLIFRIRQTRKPMQRTDMKRIDMDGSGTVYA
jgi:hypothetical protein